MQTVWHITTTRFTDTAYSGEGARLYGGPDGSPQPAQAPPTNNYRSVHSPGVLRSFVMGKSATARSS
ncbi:MAG TPA: hypothetical protein DCY18_14725 [Thauera sp.]|nr:hypothetical protein [Thauera sp.]HAY11159.1 hypothetical protein [Thauera sp.]